MTEAGWTRNVPANEGEYWFRSGGVRKPIVAHVYLDVEQDLRIIIGINDLYVTDLDGFDEFDGAEFLGPLSPTDSFQRGRVEGLREAGEYAHQCKLERNQQIVNLGGTLHGDHRKDWLECKASEARRIADKCEQLAQQAQEGK